MRDLNSNIRALVAIAPAVHAATKADGAIIDLQGIGAVTLIVQTGAVAGDGEFAASLVVGDSPTLTDGAAAAAETITGAPLPAVLAADAVYQFGYRGGHRYARVVLTKASGTSIAAGALAVAGNLALAGAV